MKRIVLTISIILFAAAMYGQKNSFDDFFNKYSGRDGYTTVIINGNLFGLLKYLDDDPDLEMLDERVTSVKIVTNKRDGNITESDFLSEINGILKHGRYEDLMTVKNHDSDLRIVIRSSGNVIKELVIVSSGESEAVIQINGDLTRDDVQVLTENHGNKLAQLEMLESSGN